MFKVSNKDTRTTPPTKWSNTVNEIGIVLVSLLLTSTYFTPCSSVSVVNFEQVNAAGLLNIILILLPLTL